MKTLLVFLLCCCFYFTNAQLSFGVKAGLSPEAKPQTPFCIINRDKPQNEFLFNSEVVHYSPTLGVFARLDRGHYWFSIEFLTYSWKEKYSVNYSYESPVKSEANTNLEERKRVLEVPISIGVTLGKVQISSGFSGIYTLKETSQLSSLAGFNSSEKKFKPAWHSGVGINLSPFLIDLRYTQFFENYGQDRSVNNWDLTLDNARTKVMASISLKF